MNSTAAYAVSHWVKLFFMNTLGKLAFSSRTTLLSICEQKDTSSKERSLQDSSNFLKDAGLTILVPVQKQKKKNKTNSIVTENSLFFFKLLMLCHEKSATIMQILFRSLQLDFKLKTSQRQCRNLPLRSLLCFPKPTI